MAENQTLTILSVGDGRSIEILRNFLEYKIVQTLGKTIRQFLIQLNIYLTSDLTMPPLAIYHQEIIYITKTSH
jgi:hypothetical protein